MIPCPQCASPIQEDSVICRYCRSQVKAPTPVGAVNRPKEEFEVIDMPREPGKPWEVWVVILVIVLNVSVNLIQGRIVGVLVGALIISGLWKQSGGAWWFVTIVNGLGAAILGIVGMSGEPLFLVDAGLCLVVVGLMISCRVRGAY
ncbi:MAG TPA: hypothetical protein VJB14_10355 [Planctomycetota bacterium]|nr:hypothetical protein [Planctomycetota bacterium]